MCAEPRARRAITASTPRGTVSSSGTRPRANGSACAPRRATATCSRIARGNPCPLSTNTEAIAMPQQASLLDELRTQYEAARQSTQEHADVEGFQEIDARLRKAFRWLEKAITYLDGLKPAIEHRFDLGHGLVFDSPRFGRGSVGQHTRRIVGFPVLDEINIYYEIVAAKALTIEVAPGGVSLVEKTLDAVALQFSSHKVETAEGTVRKCVFTVPPTIEAAVLFRVDY